MTFESCGTRIIKGGINLNIELQKHKLDQKKQEKHNNFSRQAYSFLEVKLRRLRRKTKEGKYDTCDKNLPSKANTWRRKKTYLAIEMSQNNALAWKIIEVSNSAKRHLDYSRIMQTNDLDLICCSFLTWFGHNFSAGQFLSFRSLLLARMTCYSGFFLLSFSTRFARDIGQSAILWI